MSFYTISLILLVALFVMAYITKRRFGALGLALGAGAMLSHLWAETLTPLVRETGVVHFNVPPLGVAVAVVVTLLPAVILLFAGGPSYRTKGLRLFAALGFSVFALALVIEPISSYLQLSGTSQQVYEFIMHYRVWIVTAGLILALFDLITTSSRPRPRSAKK